MRLRLAATLPFFAFALHAAPDGSTSAEFLKMGAGARGAAMGDAQTAVAEGALAALWNPAGLGNLTAGELSFTHTNWMEDMTDQRFVAALPTKNAGGFALAYERLAVDDYLSFDAEGTPGGTVDSGNSVFSLGWGRNLAGDAQGGAGFMAGAAAKMVQETIAGVSASGFAADIGLLYRPWGPSAARRPWLRRTSVGLSARNLGQGLKFDKETAPLPTEYALGFGYAHPFSGDLLTLALDLRQTTGEDSSICFGAEYWLKGLLALRAGYRPTDTEGAGLRAGAGFRLRRVTLDYAWTANGDDLEAGHRFSLAYRFGAPQAAPGLAGDLFEDHVARGRHYMELGIYDRAVLEFNQALQIKPDEDVRALLLDAGKKMEGTAP